MTSAELISDQELDRLVSNRSISIHFIGVGGAGMSALARVFLETGYKVTGSDIKESRYTRLLRDLGATVNIGHDPQVVDKQDVVIISGAIPERNPELVRSRELGKQVAVRAQLLGCLSRQKRTVAVGGTHGKTTTTSMIAHVLDRGGFDPTFVIGGELNDTGSNAGTGQSDIAVVEADESDGSLLHLCPDIAVVTNIDADHLDHYKTFAALEATFAEWMKKVPDDGLLVVHGDGSNARDIAVASGRRLTTYGLGEGNDHQASNLSFDGFGSVYDWHKGGEHIGQVRLSVPGEHNVLNSLAAAAACLEVGAEPLDVVSGLATFSGVKRRFQRMGSLQGVAVVDDYAHHPTELKATLEAARKGEWGRVLCVFQPHRFSRTRALARDFGGAFRQADIAVITEIYGAGEDPQPGVSGKLVVDAILQEQPGKNVAYLPRATDVVDLLRAISRPGDLVLTVGAGDIRSVGERFLGQDIAGPPHEYASGRPVN